MGLDVGVLVRVLGIQLLPPVAYLVVEAMVVPIQGVEVVDLDDLGGVVDEE